MYEIHRSFFNNKKNGHKIEFENKSFLGLAFKIVRGRR
jgi:hypothetical protein